MEKNREGVSISPVFDGLSKDGSAHSNRSGTAEPPTPKQEPKNPGRRSFLGKVSGVAAAVATASSVMLKPLLGGKDAAADASVVSHGSGVRARASNNYRVSTAQVEDINVGVQPDNGDITQFTDFSAQFSKSLLHDSLGLPDAKSWSSMKNALMSGSPSAFQNILMGNPGGGPNSKLNGPQCCFAFDLEGLDSHASVIPPSPSVASAQTAAEEVEHYWAALLRDVPFTQYGSSSLASQAVGDMNNLSYVNSGANNEYPAPITTQNLFRGQVFPGDGNVMGPYLSQFMVQPTALGSQPISQQVQTFLPVGGGGSDYMTNASAYQNIQNGGNSVAPAMDPTLRYIRDGRDLAAYTHVDVLYQEFFIAFLILSQINAPPNPGNPYIGSNTQKAFGTLGGPDAAGALAEMATRALKAAWFHKWIVDLRLRPEEYGALVQVRLGNNNNNSSRGPQAAGALHRDVLNSLGAKMVNKTYGSYLVPQAFPEGCPTHPCYPTGHGTVAGACITALRFFFDCNQDLRPLLTAAGRDVYVPSTNGLSLNVYNGSDANSLTINGELSKLAFNVSFGHGIHAGIHFRSSTLYSILLGEQVALSVLQDRAASYNEPFNITITKFDGTTATISNQ
ncbi:MAG: vanadium-dependent haloperoxidase [Candidatus Acidiferrales bacterium]